MFCGKCGAENEAGYKYCGKCGGPLVQDSQQETVSLSDSGQPPEFETDRNDKDAAVQTTLLNSEAEETSIIDDGATVFMPKEETVKYSAAPPPYAPANPRFVPPVNPYAPPGLVIKNKKKSKLPLILSLALVLVALLAGGAVFAVNAVKTNNFETLIEQGNKYLDELEFQDAAITFEKAIDVKPKREEGYFGAATAYVELGQEEKAVRVLKRGVENVKKPSAAFIDLCDELAIEHSFGSDKSEEKEPSNSNQKLTADDYNALRDYLSYNKGSEQIKWNNMSKTEVSELVLEILDTKRDRVVPFPISYMDARIYNLKDEWMYDSESPEAKILDEFIGKRNWGSLNATYSLDYVNRRIKKIFGKGAPELRGEDFYSLRKDFNSQSSLNSGLELFGDIPMFLAYDDELDCLLFFNSGFGLHTSYFSYISNSQQKEDTIVVNRRICTYNWDDYVDRSDIQELESPELNDALANDYKKLSEAYDKYYNDLVSKGVDVKVQENEYIIGFDEDGDPYLKKVNLNVSHTPTNQPTNQPPTQPATTPPTQPATTPPSTTTYYTVPAASYFGRVISQDFIVATQKDPLNIRSGPDKSFSRVGSVKKGEIVKGLAMSRDEQWVYINYKGMAGWVSADFLMAY